MEDLVVDIHLKEITYMLLHRMVRSAELAVLLVFGAYLGSAQGIDATRPGSLEIGGFAGASYGIDQFRVMGGGNATFAVNRWLLPYVEYSYFPGIGRTQSGVFQNTGVPYTESYSIPLSDFHGGVHVQIKIRESRIVPYLVFGMGALTHLQRTVNASFVEYGMVNQVPISVPGGTDFAINTGGGFRIYLSQRFGLRAEAKAYRPTGAFTDWFGKVEGGVFFRLR